MTNRTNRPVSRLHRPATRVTLEALLTSLNRTAMRLPYVATAASSHHVFHIPTSSLASGASVRVHTGKGSNGPGYLSC